MTATEPGPLQGRVALVTGVSRRVGIGCAIVARLLQDGASVLAAGWPDHDGEMPWGADADDPSVLVAGIADLVGAGAGSRVSHAAIDLAEPDGPDHLVRAALERFGAIDIVVANHARSASADLHDVTAEELDACWAVNARGSVLLAQALLRHHDPARSGGRLVLFTSGQRLQPMPAELPYTVSKGAIEAITPTLADRLADAGITANCINPGPVDTGYATGEAHDAIAAMFPARRWGQPDDVARLVAWLVSDDAAWITGQVINSEGGFRRSR